VVSRLSLDREEDDQPNESARAWTSWQPSKVVRYGPKRSEKNRGGSKEKIRGQTEGAIFHCKFKKRRAPLGRRRAGDYDTKKDQLEQKQGENIPDFD